MISFVLCSLPAKTLYFADLNAKHQSLSMYKKIAGFIVLSLCLVTVFAQQNNTGIAPFKITLSNGKTFTYKQLKPNTPTVLIYFSPTCDHCKEFTKELLTYQKQLLNKQIVMVGYEPVAKVKEFDSSYQVSSKPNFKIGTEGYTFIVQKYYSVQRFPFVAMYNKQMKLVKTIPFVTEPEVVSKEIAALK